MIQKHADHDGSDHLEPGLLPRRQALGPLLHDLEVVVPEPDAAEGRGREQNHPDVFIREVRPEQGGSHERDDDENPAHGGRPLLGQMRLRSVVAHVLADFESAKPGDDRLPENEADDQSGQHGAGAPKGDIFKNVERAERLAERIEQMIQH